MAGPIDQDVVTQRYAYQQVPWRAQEVDSGEGRTPPLGLLKAPAVPGKTSFPLSGIVSESKVPHWTTMGLAAFKAMALEMMVLAHCRQEQCWQEARYFWLCGLMTPGMVVKKTTEQEWRLVLG
eukprot:4632567-Lingulodinium_polyedra.AAC.1